MTFLLLFKIYILIGMIFEAAGLHRYQREGIDPFAGRRIMAYSVVSVFPFVWFPFVAVAAWRRIWRKNKG